MLAAALTAAEADAANDADAVPLLPALCDAGADACALGEAPADGLATEREGAGLLLALGERVGDSDSDGDGDAVLEAAGERDADPDLVGDCDCDAVALLELQRVVEVVADGLTLADAHMDTVSDGVGDLVFVTVSGGEMGAVGDRDDDCVRDGDGDADGLLLPLTDPEGDRVTVGDVEDDPETVADDAADTHAVGENVALVLEL